MTQFTAKTGGQRFPGFGDRLRLSMRQAGHRKLSALALELGVAESSLSRWCSGQDISLANAVALSRCLGVSLDWLVTGAEPTRPPCDCMTNRPDGEALLSVAMFLKGLNDAMSLRVQSLAPGIGPPKTLRSTQRKS